MVTESRHDVVQFFKRDESTAMHQFVLVDGLGQLVNFGSARVPRIGKLATFCPGLFLTVSAAPTIDKGGLLF